jgi:hypothetical protein
MASWALACKNCCKVFPETAADYYLPTRPAFPLSGVERECPNSKVKSTYQATELAF